MDGGIHSFAIRTAISHLLLLLLPFNSLPFRKINPRCALKKKKILWSNTRKWETRIFDIWITTPTGLSTNEKKKTKFRLMHSQCLLAQGQYCRYLRTLYLRFYKRSCRGRRRTFRKKSNTVVGGLWPLRGGGEMKLLTLGKSCSRIFIQCSMEPQRARLSYTTK